ncbi:tripartite tricarboxylate transporter TctB family protein [Halostreptopolyspora alba]|uniref:Tripartite tricarboxylate transporter TctB family protein n=1 Tax=Halostreptopolyspora alba TaxID=2487137 RepID=A0A3N0EE16_9ACTN|nr:tripartite tricarboxylate transporter TctB family protein [Nocardiopsaceae bacterium YIM 96095]
MSQTHSTTPATEQVADAQSRIPEPTASSEELPKRRNLGAVAFYAAVAIIMGIYTVLAFDMEWTTHGGDRMGPGFFPRVIGTCAVVLSLTGLVMSLRSAAAATPPTEGTQSSGKHPFLLIAIGLGLVGFVTVFIPVGAPVTAAVFLLVMYFLIQRRWIARRAVLSVAFPVLLYVLFELWLEAGLPAGITDFL